MTPTELLQSAVDQIEDRASVRDSISNGERSMLATVNAFNAMYSCEMTEEEGWNFMVLLKMSRSKFGEFHIDDYVDGAAYTALACEAKQKDNV